MWYCVVMGFNHYPAEFRMLAMTLKRYQLVTMNVVLISELNDRVLSRVRHHIHRDINMNL